MSARTFLLRTSRTAAFRQNALGAGLGLAVVCQQHRQQGHFKFDAPLAAPSQPPLERAYSSKRKPQLDPEVMKQMSGGSLAGFLSGMIVSVFSKTLVLMLGLSFAAVQIAARYGIDLVDHFKLKQRVGDSKILTLLQKNPTFKLSFAAFFTLAAFMHF